MEDVFDGINEKLYDGTRSEPIVGFCVGGEVGLNVAKADWTQADLLLQSCEPIGMSQMSSYTAFERSSKELALILYVRPS